MRLSVSFSHICFICKDEVKYGGNFWIWNNPSAVCELNLNLSIALFCISSGALLCISRLCRCKPCCASLDCVDASPRCHAKLHKLVRAQGSHITSGLLGLLRLLGLLELLYVAVVFVHRVA